MRHRSAPSVRAGRRVAVSIDLVLCTPRDGRLTVLLQRGHDGWMLPHAAFHAGEIPDVAAARHAATALGRRPAWLGQIGAFGDTRGPGVLKVAYVGVVPSPGAEARDGFGWRTPGTVPSLSPRHREIVHAAVAALRDRMDRAPVAFGLLPSVFTLGALQAVYELLIGRRLHKASFRRTLQAAHVVTPTNEWRTEGRGRPAQLFRYAPRRGRGARPSVRFELLAR